MMGSHVRGIPPRDPLSDPRPKPQSFFTTVRGRIEYLIEAATDQWLNADFPGANWAEFEAEAEIRVLSSIFNDHFDRGVMREDL